MDHLFTHMKQLCKCNESSKQSLADENKLIMLEGSNSKWWQLSGHSQMTCGTHLSGGASLFIWGVNELACWYWILTIWNWVKNWVYLRTNIGIGWVMVKKLLTWISTNKNVHLTLNNFKGVSHWWKFWKRWKYRDKWRIYGGEEERQRV